MADLPEHIIVISAVDHPDVNASVLVAAATEGRKSGMTVGKYIGREDVFGPGRASDLCCHVFEATPIDRGQDDG